MTKNTENKALEKYDPLKPFKKIKANKKLVIVGTASTWNKAPFDKNGFDFWGLNGLHGYTEPSGVTGVFSLWFQIHKREEVIEQEDHYNWLKSTEVPIVTQVPFNEFKKNLLFPKDFILNRYPHYFKSSFGWMICLAMELGYEEIQFFGVHVSSDSEYAYQKPNTEFYIGMAMGRGIRVYIPSEADIVQEGSLYAFDDTNAIREKFDHEINGLKERKEKLEDQVEKAKVMMAKYQGAIERDTYWKRQLG